MAEPDTPQDEVFYNPVDWHFTRGVDLRGDVKVNTSLDLGSLESLLDTPVNGEFTGPRYGAIQGSGAHQSGVLYLSFFTARKTEAITKLRMWTTGTAAGATPSLVRWGVYSVDANGDCTLIASIPSDTTLFAATFTAYTRDLSAPWNKVRGQRYAVGDILVTAAALPTVVELCAATAGIFDPIFAELPRLSGARTGQVDLPANITNAQFAATRLQPFVQMLAA